MVAIASIVLGQLAVGRLDWVAQYPSAWVLPLKDWIDSFFEWLVYGVHFFSGTSLEFTPRNLTRGFSAVLAYPLGFTDRKSTRLTSSHYCAYRMQSSA